MSSLYHPFLVIYVITDIMNIPRKCIHVVTHLLAGDWKAIEGSVCIDIPQKDLYLQLPPLVSQVLNDPAIYISAFLLFTR